MFSCELCKIFKNTYFYSTPLVAASGVFFTKQSLSLWLKSEYIGGIKELSTSVLNIFKTKVVNNPLF